MSLVFVIYLIDVLCGKWEGLGIFMGFFIFFAIVAYGFRQVEFGHDDDDVARKFWKKTAWMNKAGITFFIILTLVNFIPSKDTAYKMLAAYGVTELATNEHVQQYGTKALKVLDKAMGEYLGEEYEDTTEDIR